jgi:SOS-response transcriptional repressor LexA
VLLGEEATLKRVYTHEDHIDLKAENDQMPDIRVDKNQAVETQILRLYTGLIRRAR